MLKAYKYRIYPNKTQMKLIEKHFGSTRFLYNYFLEYRQKAYANGNQKVGYMVTQAELTKLKKKKEYEWLNECGSQSLFRGWVVHVSLKQFPLSYPMKTMTFTGSIIRMRKHLINAFRRCSSVCIMKLKEKSLEENKQLLK